MIRNAFTGEPKAVPKAVHQQSDVSGSPAPEHISGTEVPETKQPAPPLPEQHPAG